VIHASICQFLLSTDGSIISSSDSVIWSTGANKSSPSTYGLVLGILASHQYQSGVFIQYQNQSWNIVPGANLIHFLSGDTMLGHQTELHHELQLLSLNLVTAQLVRFSA
jgi:hypothetical protein